MGTPKLKQITAKLFQSDLEEEELEKVDESTLDEDEKLARQQKIQQMMAAREEKRLAREQREIEKAELEQLKFERREKRRIKREAKETAKKERQALRDTGIVH